MKASVRVLEKISREKYDKERDSIWQKVRNAEANNDPDMVLMSMAALLADIHTMLEHLTVEPYEEDTE